MSTPFLAPLSVRVTCGGNSGDMVEEGGGVGGLTLRFVTKQDARRGKNGVIEYTQHKQPKILSEVKGVKEKKKYFVKAAPPSSSSGTSPCSSLVC